MSNFPEKEIDGEACLDPTEIVLTNQMKLKDGQMIKVIKHVKSFESYDLVS
jgi:hypothetical protein